MITILHGDDISTSRTFYKSLQKKDMLLFDGEKMTLDDITQAVQTTSLFGEEKSIAIENFFSKRKASKEMDSLITFFKEIEKDNEIIFWETKVLTKKSLLVFPKANVKTFTFPQSLFTFLDNLKPNNTKKVLSLYHDTQSTTETEMIFFMIIRHIRILLALQDTADTEIDEIKRMAPWQKNKVLSQSRLFSLSELKEIYAKLFALEVKNKTGGLALPLSQSIDFLLISI